MKKLLSSATGIILVLVIWGYVIHGYVECEHNHGTYVRGVFSMQCINSDKGN